MIAILLAVVVGVVVGWFWRRRHTRDETIDYAWPRDDDRGWPWA